MSTINAVAHGFSGGECIVFSNVIGGEGTTPVIEGDPYYVLAAGITADTFSFSETDGGAAFVFDTEITEGDYSLYPTYEPVADGVMDPPVAPTTPGAPTVASTLVTDTEGHVLVHLKVTPNVPA